MNSEPASGIESQSYSRMKQFWGEYSKQKEGQIKEELEKRRRLRRAGQKCSDVLAIEEADRIVKSKLADVDGNLPKQSNAKSTPGEAINPSIAEYEHEFSSTNKPDNELLEVSDRITTLEDCDALEDTTRRRFRADALKLTIEDTDRTDNSPVVVDETKINVVSNLIVPQLCTHCIS